MRHAPIEPRHCYTLVHVRYVPVEPRHCYTLVNVRHVPVEPRHCYTLVNVRHVPVEPRHCYTLVNVRHAPLYVEPSCFTITRLTRQCNLEVGVDCHSAPAIQNLSGTCIFSHATDLAVAFPSCTSTASPLYIRAHLLFLAIGVFLYLSSFAIAMIFADAAPRGLKHFFSWQSQWT